jgi:hypothetical protein
VQVQTYALREILPAKKPKKYNFLFVDLDFTDFHLKARMLPRAHFLDGNLAGRQEVSPDPSGLYLKGV